MRVVLLQLIVTRMAAAVHKILPQSQFSGDWTVYQETFDELNKISLTDIRHPGEIPQCNVPARTLADILSRCTNLVKLGLHVPASANRHSAYKELHSPIASSGGTLKALELYYCPSGLTYRPDINYHSFRPFDYRALLELPSLTQITLNGSLLTPSTTNLNQARYEWAASLREINLDRSVCDARVLSLLVRAATQLERLSIDGLAGLRERRRFVSWVNPAAVAELNELLILRAQTLRVLHIGAKHISPSQFLNESFESGPRLRCLPLLDRLEELALPMNALTTTKLAGKLPKSLRSLILDDTALWKCAGPGEGHREEVISSLTQIYDSVAAKSLPNLERIQYMWDFPTIGIHRIPTVMEMEDRLWDLQTRFREVGVKLCTQE